MYTAVEAWLGQALPPSYQTFLRTNAEDVSVGDFVLLYGVSSVIERNETYEARRYCPGYLTIGDDGGGRQILLNLATEQISLVDAGSMDPVYTETTSERFSDWLEAGCPLPDEG